MGKLFGFILQCAFILLVSQATFAKSIATYTPATHSIYAKDVAGHQVYLGFLYEAGQYPGKHRLFIHKKVLNPFSAVDVSEMWVQTARIPSFTVHYFSLLYRSHISAILNSNDLLRGPPVSIV